MSLEVNSTSSTFTTSSSSSTSGANSAPVDNTNSRFSCLHKIIENCLSSLASIKPDDEEGPDDLEEAKNSVLETYAFLYLDNVDAICKELKNEVDSSDEVNSLASDGYLNSIKNVCRKKATLEREIVELDKIFNEDITNIQSALTPVVAEKFRKRVSAEIDILKDELKNYCHEKTDKLVEKALKEFYNTNLDSYPNLHPGLEGSGQKAIAQHYCHDIKDFLKDNDEMDRQYRDALFECSSKLEGAIYFETMEKSANKTKHALQIHAQAMESKVKNLKVGESCIFLGGTAGHAVIYEVIRKSKDTCEFTIINTGDDEQNPYNRKPDSIDQFFMSKTQYGHKSYVVNADALDSNFLLKLIQFKEKRVPMADVIKEIDQQFKTKSQLGRIHHSQERGSCAAKSAASYVKGELIRKLGEKKGTALYLQLKHDRAKKSYDAILKLEKEVPKAHFQNAYSIRTYKPQKTRYDKKEVIIKVPATDSQLKKHLTELHSTADQVIQTWGEKAKKAQANL